MKFELQKASKEDFTEIARIYAEEFSKPPYNEPWTQKKAMDKLDVFSRYCDIFKIITDSQTIGFIILNPNQWCPGDTVFIEDFAIASKFQNNGIGTQVLKKIFESYGQKGYSRFIALSNRNSRAYNLYKRLEMTGPNENEVIQKTL
jgi:aminoglycoside 6'-N-acetyltransferase I